MTDINNSNKIFQEALKFLSEDNKGLAIAKMLDAADLENPEANFFSALFYFTGTGVQRNLKSATGYANKYIKLDPNGKYVNEAFSIVDETIGTENAKRILFGSSHPYAPAYKTLNNSKATRNFFPAIFSLIVLILVLLSFYFFKSIQNENVNTFNDKQGKASAVLNLNNDLVDLNKISEIEGTSFAKVDLTKMLFNFNQPLHLIEIKKEIENNIIKLEQGDINQARVLNKLGLDFMNNNNFIQANKYFLDANNANPADIEVMNNVGYSFIKLGDFKSAENWIGHTLSFAPGRAIAWANLGEIYSEIEKNDSAKAAFVISFNLASNREKVVENMKEILLQSEYSENLKKNIANILTFLNKN